VQYSFLSRNHSITPAFGALVDAALRSISAESMTVSLLRALPPA
jgi:hypothetical protein